MAITRNKVYMIGHLMSFRLLTLVGYRLRVEWIAFANDSEGTTKALGGVIRAWDVRDVSDQVVRQIFLLEGRS